MTSRLIIKLHKPPSFIG